MFRKPAIQVSLTRPQKQETPTDPNQPYVPPLSDRILVMLQDNAKPALLTVAGVVAANKVLNTSLEIAVIAAKSKFK